MNMMQMVGIMVACYFIALILLCVYRNVINVKIFNILFLIADIVFFFGWNYGAYMSGWLHDGYMTLDNISQMTMTLIPVTFLLKDKVREFCNSAIAFLWVGMFLAIMLSPPYAYIFNFKTEASLRYSAETACHLLASLYGVYLIISGQVKCEFKNWRRALICLYSIVGFGVFLNFVFHKSHFGMDPYGDYSIYMLDIFGSFESTLVAYILGILVVVTLGLQVGHLINKLVNGEPEGAVADVPSTDEPVADGATEPNEAEGEIHSAPHCETESEKIPEEEKL